VVLEKNFEDQLARACNEWNCS